MTNNPVNNLADKLAVKILPIMVKIEIVLIICFIIGLSLIQVDSQISSIIITFSLSFFTLIYFMLGARDDHGTENKIIIFLNKITYWSYSASVIGILFVIQMWPGSNIMLTAGASSIIMSTIVFLILRVRTPKDGKINDSNLIRSFIIIVLISFLYFNGNIEAAKKKELLRNNTEMTVEPSQETVR